GHDEGLRSLQAEGGFAPGAVHARDGHIWIPLRSALAEINPSRLPENLDPPPVLLKRIAMDGQTLGAYGGVMPVGNILNLQASPSAHLPAGHHRLEFEFTALNLTTPENMQFRYKLVGVDDDWIDGKNQRSASYPGLAAGHYRFQVTARKNGGAWNPKPAIFEFSIQPFIWETWWFKIFALIIFTASVVAIGRYVSFRRLRRKLQTLEQQSALERERSRIAKDIHDDLGGSLTQAALLLNLASQDCNATEKIGVHLQQATATVRQITESLDEIVWAANPRNDTFADLNDYISLFAVQFLEAAGIRCRIDSPKQFPNRVLSPEIRHGLFLVIKESLNNVVRHARANEVQLQIVVTNELLKINIADDGRGFNSQSNGNYCSDGLRNMKQRMTEIGGEFFVESKSDSGTKISAVYFWQNKK
ncbi:MAG TPA: triple tyrosine motif-containing protein, partial [Verrucomicrobiae bacterium]|nr:triple tyrosine motif-containing protein [Verrucomicrobiae bacterium]